MATLWIREYFGSGGEGDGGELPIAAEPGRDQTVTFTTTTQSAAFRSDTTYISIIGSAAFHYVVGASPTATTANLKVPADTLLYIGVQSGQKIAAVAAA